MLGMSAWHWAIVAVAVYLPLVLYVRTFLKTAEAVVFSGGSAPTTSAWLLLVPGLGSIWYFVLLLRLRAAIAESGRTMNGSLWLIYGIVAGVEGLLAPFIRWFGFIFLVFAVLHWAELAKLRNSFVDQEVRTPH